MKIKIAVARGRNFMAPGIDSYRSSILGTSVCRTMKLGLGRQFSSQPSRVSGGLSVAQVNWPVAGQTHLAKHSAVKPQISIASPERGMLHVVGGFPIPGFVVP